MVCFSATGYMIKPFIIIPKRKKFPKELNSLIYDITLCSSAKGWINDNIWEIWGWHFLNEINLYRKTLPPALRNEKILLISDGHQSRGNLKVLNLFHENNIELLILPAHLSHILQPFDVGIAGALKMNFKKSVVTSKNNFNIDNVSETAKIRLLYIKCFIDALQSTITINTARNSFLKSGLFPLNIEIPLSSGFVNTNRVIAEQSERKSKLEINGKLITTQEFINELTNKFKADEKETHFDQFENLILEWRSNDPSFGRLLNTIIIH